MSARAHNYISPEEYLRREEVSEVRHEYIDGEVYAMAGGTMAHNQIAINLVRVLTPSLRRAGCLAFLSDLKVSVETINAYYYPDLAVQCGGSRSGSSRVIDQPVVIVEVLSPSTELFDRVRKFEHYRLLPSLREYLLLSQDRIWAECYRKNEEGRFVLFTSGPAEELVLESLDFRCPMEALYEDVEFPPESDAEAARRVTGGEAGELGTPAVVSDSTAR